MPVQVPFDSLRRTTRDRKYLIDEVQDIISAMKDNSSKQQTAQERSEVLRCLTERLEGLKRKARLSIFHSFDWSCSL